MKKVIKNTFIALLAIFTYTSCEDYFDTVPSDTISLDAVFTNRLLTQQWLSNVYSYLPDETEQNYSGGDNRTNGIWTPASLEAKLPWDQCQSNVVIGGSLHPSTGYVSDMWKAYYRGIQKANTYIQNVDRCTMMTERERTLSKTEARALRAIYYFYLFKLYGPFVNVGDQIFDPEAEANTMILTRSSVDDCVDYIVSEFDEILKSNVLISHFDGENSRQFRGNITKEIVAAVRSQVLLYAASDLFNGNPYYKDLKNKDGEPLFPQTKSQKKWEDARDAAAEFIRNYPFRLVYRDISGQAVSDVSLSCPFNSVSYAYIGRDDNEEMIFYHTGPGRNNEYYSMPKHSGIPQADSGGGALAVPLQFVDLFFTKDGYRIEDVDDDDVYFEYGEFNGKEFVYDDSKFTRQNMVKTEEYRDQFSNWLYFRPSSAYRVMKQYYNREPRFYLAFTFQNRHWSYDTSKTYYTDFSLNGNSGRAKNGHDYPRSGMLVRKYKESSRISSQYNIMIRLAEIYLNYAEALTECGDLTTAIEYVNKIRSRAGIAEYTITNDQTPDARGLTKISIDNTYEAVRNAVRRERLIELAFESHHYFDVRRWKVAGMEQGDGWVYPSWHKGGEGGEMFGYDVEVDMSPDSPEINPDYLSFYKRKAWETRIFTERMNLFPIPQAEININPLIVQNSGWTVDVE